MKSKPLLIFSEPAADSQSLIRNPLLFLAIIIHIAIAALPVSLLINQFETLPEATAFAWPLHSVENQQLSLWAEANDPALLSPTMPATQQLLQLEPIGYIASYDSQPPDIVTVTIPPATPKTTIPRPMPSSFQTNFQAPGFAFPPQSHILINGPFELAQQPDLTKLNQLIDGSTIPYSASFDVAISPEGHVRYLFLQRTSSLPTLDKAARHLLYQTQFTSSSSNNLRWGQITVQWGLNVFRKPNAE